MPNLATEFFHFATKPTDQEFREAASRSGVILDPDASILWIDKAGTLGYQATFEDAMGYLRTLHCSTPNAHIGVCYQMIVPTGRYMSLTRNLSKQQEKLKAIRDQLYFADYRHGFKTCGN